MSFVIQSFKRHSMCLFSFFILWYNTYITFLSFSFMGDNALRHMIAMLATVICALAYYAGYISGQNGWWWTFFSLVIIYGGVYKLVNK